MSDSPTPSRKALADAVTALVGQHGGPSAVGDKVGAHRTTVHRWMAGDIGIDKLGVLADKLGVPITVRFGPEMTIEPRPDVPDGADAPAWAERLTDKILGEIRMIRDESVESAVRAIADRLGPQILAELAPEGEDQPPPKPAGRGASPR